MKFKTMSGKKIEKDVVQYIKDHMAKDSEAEYKLYIGCDSQVSKRYNVYATVVVIHKVGKGAHVIYTRDQERKKANSGSPGNVFVRLWGEVERTMKMFEFLQEKGFAPETLAIDFDFNTKKDCRSNQVLASAVGYASAYGVDVRVKPQAWSATYAANKLCR